MINMVWASAVSPKRNKTPKSLQVCNGPGIHNLFCKVRLQRLQNQNTKVGIASVIIYSFFAYFKELEFHCFNQHCYPTDFCNNLTNCMTNSPLALRFTQITYQGVDLRLSNTATQIIKYLLELEKGFHLFEVHCTIYLMHICVVGIIQ